MLIAKNTEEKNLKKVYIINGPNMNLLGIREPNIYGIVTLGELEAKIKKEADKNHLIVDFFQSNHEGEIIDYIQKISPDSYIIINPAGLTHNSVSLRDCISAIGSKTIEVHISNISAREPFRSSSVISGVCNGVIMGLGIYGYFSALNWVVLDKE